tara:strand:- start:1724 stop:2779 length:1056 start_codon:yes stop_codon:yes gene_type:complete
MSGHGKPTQLTDIPSDVLRIIGLFSGVPGMSALSKTCRTLNVTFGPTEHNLTRNVPTLKEATQIGHMLGRGKQTEVKSLLDKAKHAGTIDQLFDARISITDSQNRTLHHITFLQYTFWSLDRNMFNMLKEYASVERINHQLLEHMSANPPSYVRENDRHIDLDGLNAKWKAFNDYTAGINWKAFKSGSDEDTQCQALFLPVIQAMAELPAHMISELLNPVRSLLVKGEMPKFNESQLARLSSLPDGTSFNNLKHGTQFGETYGILRLQKKPIRAELASASTYARSFVKSANNLISITSINANGVAHLGKVRLAWLRDLTANALSDKALRDKAPALVQVDDQSIESCLPLRA